MRSLHLFTWLLTLSVALLATAPATAVPLTWTLQGVEFGTDGTASGSFDFDADTGTYSNVSLTLSELPDFQLPLGGTTIPVQMPATSFTTGNVVQFSGGFPASDENRLFVLAPYSTLGFSGARGFELIFASPLTNAGGVLSLLPFTGQGFCTTLDCLGGPSGSTVISQLSATSGVVVATPEAGAAALLLAAGLSFGVRARGASLPMADRRR